MLADLTQADFEYYKKRASAMRDCHEKEFLKVIDPVLMRCFYRGRKEKYNDTDEHGFYNKREHYLALSRIFTATNTLGPNLYYQNPRPIVTPAKNGTKEGAALLSASLRQNLKDNNSKEQNLEACLSAWFFGLGWKKIGMRNHFISKNPEPESQGGFLDQAKNMMGMSNPSDSLETEQDYFLDTQSFFNDTESPENIMLDDKTPLRTGRLRLHRVKRSLYDLMNSSAYDEAILNEINLKLKYERGSRLDARDIELDLNELQIKHPNGLWICSWVDQYNKAIRYDLSTYQKGFQLIPLVFTNEPFSRYPISHLKVASQIQEQLDYMATLYVKIIDRVRNQILVNKGDLAPGMEKAILANKLGGVVFTNKPINAGTFAQLTSAAVSNDLPQLMQVVQQNLTEILGADEQLISGRSKNDTLGQDELARVGTKVRESGMLDRVRDWMIKQFEQEAYLMQNYDEGEKELKVEGKDYANMPLDQNIDDQYLSFGTQENPVPFKSQVPGAYDYDMNIYEAVKPDKEVLKQEYAEGIALFSKPEIQQAGVLAGVRYRVDKLAEGYADNFEYIRSRDFVEKLDPMQQAALQTSMMMMSGQVGGNSGGDMPKEKPKKGDVSNPSSEAATI